MRTLPLATAGLYPISSLASGGEVLSLLWVEVALLVAVVASLILCKLAASMKLLVFVAYLVGVGLAWALVWDVPYSANQLVVSAVSVGVPAAIWLGGLVLAFRIRKNITSRSTGDGAKEAPRR